MLADAAGPQAGPVPDRSPLRSVLAATILGSSMEFIDGTVVNVALPQLQTSLNATGAEVQWIVEAYTLFLAALLLVGGSLGDRFGLRRVFLAGVLSFAGASLLCGLAPGIYMLLLARCLQGVSGALLVPNSLALLSASFPPERRARAIGTWSGAAATMTAVGPLLGGWLVERGSWRLVFFLNVPIAAVAAVLLLRTGNVAKVAEAKPVDLAGALLGTLGLGGVTYALLQAATGGVPVLLAGVAGVLLLTAFVGVERRAAAPMLPLPMFRNRTFRGANLLTLLLYGALTAALFYLPLNLMQVQGYTPLEAGAALMPFVGMMLVLSRWAGGLLDRYGARLPLVAGPAITAAGLALLALPGLGGRYWSTYFGPMLLLGLGMSISVAPLTTVVMGSVAEEQAGTASGINNAVSQTAGLLALALSAPLVFVVFGHALGARLNAAGLPPAEIAGVLAQKARLAAISTADAVAQRAVHGAFLSAFQVVALVAAGLAGAAAAVAGCMLPARYGQSGSGIRHK